MLKSNSCLVSEIELQNKIASEVEAQNFDESDNLINRAVTVRMMKLEWFTKEVEA